MNPIALITDFGVADHFVGSMKAAILGINPRAVIIDISHSIPAGDISAAASMLLLCYRDFPKSTIFIVVVDPGVGSGRKAIAIKSGSYYFVGPDNGVLSLACEKGRGTARRAPTIIRRIENESFFRKPISSTFHGRDIFGPVAGHLSKGNVFEKLGPLQDSYIHLQLPQVRMESNRIIGNVIAIDHFGNCITTIESSHIEKLSNKKVKILLKGSRNIPLGSCYSDVTKGKSLGLIGSAGFLEISIHGGNAAEKLKIKRDDRVVISTFRQSLMRRFAR
jgi:S-adenosyl-L-methionine hydrolase (adenosine-forming)